MLVLEDLSRARKMGEGLAHIIIIYSNLIAVSKMSGGERFNL